MSWTELLNREIESTFGSTENLINLVEDGALGWKPSTGENWMTTGQLLHHIVSACGAGMKGFVTGDWGLPEGVSMEDLTPEDMLPPAEKMPALASVDEAKKMLAEDKQLALDMVAQTGEEKLRTITISAPWDPREMVLGHRLLQMVHHLDSHKSQLFYYLKLQGKPVNTGHLWGM